MDLPASQILETAERHGATNVRIFGSRARGEAHAESDLDLLIRPGPGMSLFDLINLQLDLQELLGIKVDVVSENGLHPLLKENILDEARPLDG